MKGCRRQQGFHTESCKQGNASVTLICATVSCSPSWRRSRLQLPTSRPRWRPLWVQSVSRWNIYAKESWEHNLTRLAAQHAGSRQAQLLSSRSHVPCLFVLLASGLSGMNYESTLEEAASHTRKHNRPRVVAVLDKSDKLSSVVCVNAKQGNVWEPKRAQWIVRAAGWRAGVHREGGSHSRVRGRHPHVDSLEPSEGMLGHYLSKNVQAKSVFFLFCFFFCSCWFTPTFTSSVDVFCFVFRLWDYIGRRGKETGSVFLFFFFKQGCAPRGLPQRKK